MVRVGVHKRLQFGVWGSRVFGRPIRRVGLAGVGKEGYPLLVQCSWNFLWRLHDYADDCCQWHDRAVMAGADRPG